MAETEVVIEVLNDGPLWVEPAAGISLTDHEGNSIPIPEGKKGVALCRCGSSSKKPFCDGTHRDVQFKGSN